MVSFLLTGCSAASIGKLHVCVYVVEKTAHAECVTGRERPHDIFGRLKAEKVGSLPPDLTFFPRLVLCFAFFYVFRLQRLGSAFG